MNAIAVLAAVVVVVVVGRYLAGPALRIVAKTRLRELFTALSMVLTPILFTLLERGILPRFGTTERPEEREADHPEEQGPVLVAGFGRFGNIAGRFLMANGIQPTVLDHDSDQVDLLRKLGTKAYYGDVTQARAESPDRAGWEAKPDSKQPPV